MPFAAGLRQSLEFRQSQVPAEITRGEGLEQVLSRYLLAVEAMADRELITSILLLNEDGTRLSHGAGPGLPRSYRDAIDGSAIGPTAGSCGTAAYLGQPIYVADIATDPLWKDYRHVALPHGLRSCWSTPIRAPGGQVIGTFAIYTRTPGLPDDDEVEAIGLITDHVAHAIMVARDAPQLHGAQSRQARLKLVVNRDSKRDALRSDRLLSLAETLRAKATELDRMAALAESHNEAETFRATAVLTRKLVRALRRKFGDLSGRTTE